MASTSRYSIDMGRLMSTDTYSWSTYNFLGKGEQASVYIGRHSRHLWPVAVKVFHVDSLSKKQKSADDLSKRQDAILQEIQLMRTLDHPNVVRFIGSEVQPLPSFPILVMELCEGNSLKHILGQAFNYYGLVDSDFLTLLKDVCAGVQYLWSKRVEHRNIKPGNILLSVSEGLTVYKLSGFGSARSLDGNASGTCGAEDYAHPSLFERFVLKPPTAQLPATTKGDLWSLGATWYHAATGRLPFQAHKKRNNRQALFAILSQKASGVISGSQSEPNGPIQWRTDLPESSTLSDGLRDLICPLLAGLMELDDSKMMTYDELFASVARIGTCLMVNVFHYCESESLFLYLPSTSNLAGVQNAVAEKTGIRAEDQLLLFEGRPLAEDISPLLPLKDYPASTLVKGIVLFSVALASTRTPCKTNIPYLDQTVPDADELSDDILLASTCCALGGRMRRYSLDCSAAQKRLLSNMRAYRSYVETQFSVVAACLNTAQALAEESEAHLQTFTCLLQMIKLEAVQAKPTSEPYITALQAGLHSATVVKLVLDTSRGQTTGFQQYLKDVQKGLENIKARASADLSTCDEARCFYKIVYLASYMENVLDRFRRDKATFTRTSARDTKIHDFEKQKLTQQALSLQTLVTNHCRPRLEDIFAYCVPIVKSLTQCLLDAKKVEESTRGVVAHLESIKAQIAGLRDNILGLRYTQLAPLTPALPANTEWRPYWLLGQSWQKYAPVLAGDAVPMDLSKSNNSGAPSASCLPEGATKDDGAAK
ncbi:serine/threonine-protein kinase TBK1-like [Elysia marginata]|uniref:Serine/threonine-protein kinase TBK1-like n=1 Tax=Elysia marginata TaxID=1093978 RepID=A0AAV4H2F4_9GAST|nr:serine/threonine-protein kinase TBK1-like [Elysia marginata]